ncbi:MAG: DUF2017 family protein [Verrucomicrobiae bacterium]|nr:DUF2017 family protein [Verrucomicrobiae bacterium]
MVSENNWAFEHLGPFEWRFFTELPADAAGESVDAYCRRRLLPDPLDVPAGKRGEHEDFINDWNEYVRPDLTAGFREARERVAADLKNARRAAASLPPTEEGHPGRISVALDGVEAWYSTLNQARLLLNEQHRIADSIDNFIEEDMSIELQSDLLLLLAKYEFYTAVQAIMVENLMRP